jgi:hypothetical protein
MPEPQAQEDGNIFPLETGMARLHQGGEMHRLADTSRHPQTGAIPFSKGDLLWNRPCQGGWHNKIMKMGVSVTDSGVKHGQKHGVHRCLRN